MGALSLIPGKSENEFYKLLHSLMIMLNVKNELQGYATSFICDACSYFDPVGIFS